MKKAIRRNTIETLPGYKELDALLTEAIHEFALSRERVEIHDEAIKASQASTRATLDQLSIELGEIAARRDSE